MRVLAMLFCTALVATTSARAQDVAAAKELRRIPADEARQGVASDAHFVYAIADSKIGKYDKATGKRVALFEGDPKVFIHLNSCSVVAAELVCAMSNFPNLPQVSSVEWFSTQILKHLRSYSFGPTRGSMTWIDWHESAWWVAWQTTTGRAAILRGTTLSPLY